MIDTMQHPMTPIIAAKFAILKPLLDEQARRLWAAVGSARWPKQQGCHGRPSGQACRNSLPRPPPLACRLLQGGYAALEGDANHWGRVIHTSYRPWKLWSIL